MVSTFPLAQVKGVIARNKVLLLWKVRWRVDYNVYLFMFEERENNIIYIYILNK